MNCCSTAPTGGGEKPEKRKSRRQFRDSNPETFEVHVDELCSACYCGDLLAVERLVTRGADPHRVRPAWTAPTGGYWVSVPPVWIAAFQGRLSVVKYLVQEGRVNAQQVGSFERSTPLEAASDHWQCPGCRAALPAPDLRINPPSCDQCGQAYLDTRSPPHQRVVAYLKAVAEATEVAAGGTAWSRQRPSTAAATETSDQLQQLKLTELRRKALAAGLPHGRVDAALDSELPREALIALLLERRPVSAPSIARHSTTAATVAGLGVDLDSLGVDSDSGAAGPLMEPEPYASPSGNGHSRRLRQWRRERAASQFRSNDDDEDEDDEEEAVAASSSGAENEHSDADELESVETASDEAEARTYYTQQQIAGSASSDGNESEPGRSDGSPTGSDGENRLRRRPTVLDTAAAVANMDGGSSSSSPSAQLPSGCSQPLSSPALIRALYADRSTDRNRAAANAANAANHDGKSPDKGQGRAGGAAVGGSAGSGAGGDGASDPIGGGPAKYQQYLKWAARMRGDASRHNRAPTPTA